MAWNTAETRRRLREAATEEFAAHGPHGTTVDRIAARAGVNKERLYNYFGSKDRLFAVVLSDELAKVALAAPVELARRGEIGEFAGHVFDYHTAHPRLSRLLHWEGLFFAGAVPDESSRCRHYREKVEAFASAQREGLLTDQIPPADLVFLVIAMAAWWFAVPQVARMLTGTDDGVDEHARRRASLVAAVRRMAASPADSPEPAAGDRGAVTGQNSSVAELAAG